jgi:hypothetical protein
MRFLSLRLKPKAAARPRMGRGPGTDDVAGAVFTLKARSSPLKVSHGLVKELESLENTKSPPEYTSLLINPQFVEPLAVCVSPIVEKKSTYGVLALKETPPVLMVTSEKTPLVPLKERVPEL